MVQERGTRSWTQVVRVVGKRLDFGSRRIPGGVADGPRRIATNNRAPAKGGVGPRHPNGELLTFGQAIDSGHREMANPASGRNSEWVLAMAASVLAWR